MKFCAPVFLFFIFIYKASAQDNFEIQVYPAETISKGATMIELHSNFTFGGSLVADNNVLPTHHQLHETIEITHGFNDLFETGAYIFSALNNDGHYSIIGSNLRPRICVPVSWKLPIGLSLSTEIGYMDPNYTPDPWSLEIRGIIDKKWKAFYLALNLVLDKSLQGINQNKGLGFTPSAKFCYNFIKPIALGIEYYSVWGEISNFDNYAQQHHQLFFTADIDYFKNWEINAGYGLGLTKSTDNSIFKVIVGYKIDKKTK